MTINERAASGIAFSPLTQILARRLPLRGGSRLVYESYRRVQRECRPAPTTTRSVFTDLFNVDFDSWLEWQLWAFGTYERQLGEFLRTILNDGDRAVDVGANVGVHTIRMAKLVGDSGHVLAIEPAPSIAERLRANVRLNNLTNVQVVEAAVAALSGNTVSLHEGPESDPNKARASLLNHEYLSGPVQKVPTVALDDLVSRSIKLIKIDVEGAEIGVLNGARSTIDEYRPVVIFEFSPPLAQPGPSPLDYFRLLNYEMLEMKIHRNVLTGVARLTLRKLVSVPVRTVNIVARPITPR